jgi:hypothetical protein
MVLPTRVVEIQAPQLVRLRTVSTENERGQYACLSHCWGGKVPLTTTSKTLSRFQDTGTSSGSQYLRIMVEATAEHLRLTMQHATTIEAPKSFQKFPPQSYLKVLQRTHHREKYTLLPQKSKTQDFRGRHYHLASSMLST